MKRNRHNRLDLGKYGEENVDYEFLLLLKEMCEHLEKNYRIKEEESIDVHLIPYLDFVDGSKSLCWLVECVITDEKRIVLRGKHGNERRATQPIGYDPIPIYMLSRKVRRYIKLLLKRCV